MAFKDKSPDNFWRSAKWVIKANANLIYNHSERGRQRNKVHDVTSKRKASYRKYNTSAKGKLRRKVEMGPRTRDIRKSFNRDPLQFVKRQMNLRTTRIQGALRAGF